MSRPESAILEGHVVQDNPANPCPPEILAMQVGVKVAYLGFDGAERQGVIEVHRDVADDVRTFFDLAFRLQFPIDKVVLSSDLAYEWDDDKLMADNATTGFNYRLIAGTHEPSLHGRGLAFDVNDRLNPYIRYENGKEIVAPPNATWNPEVPGTLHKNHPLVLFMKERGWEWGGDWTGESGRTDYQHFQKNQN